MDAFFILLCQNRVNNPVEVDILEEDRRLLRSERLNENE